MSYTVKTEMTTTTYTTEKVDRAYMTGKFEKVEVFPGRFENDSYTIDAFVGVIDLVKRDAIAQCNRPHTNYKDPYSVIGWTHHYFVRVIANTTDRDGDFYVEFDNLKDAVDYYLGFERGTYCEKVIYQERVLKNGKTDVSVVTYA